MQQATDGSRRPRRRWFLWLLAPAGAVILFLAIRNADRIRSWLAAEPEASGEEPHRVVPDAAGNLLVTLDAANRKRVGLRVEPVRFGSLAPARTAYGIVLTVEPLVELDARAAAAEVSLETSRAEYERVRKLHEDHQGASLQRLESAAAAFHSDEIQLAGVLRRIQVGWGKSIGGLSTADRKALVDRLVRRDAALVRVALPAAEPLGTAPVKAFITSHAREGSPVAGAVATTNRILDAPAAKSRVEGRAFLLLVEEKAGALPPGCGVVARLELAGKPRTGAFIPPGAVVRFEGGAWVYVQAAPGRYARRRISAGTPAQDAWFETEGFRRGEAVVVEGAQTLLSEELRPRIHLEEEGEEE